MSGLRSEKQICPGDAERRCVLVPTLDDLKNLRACGIKVGYNGFYIYLRYQAILSVLAGRTFRRVLNIGCGYGIFDRLLPQDVDLTGVDISADEIEFASAWAATHRPTYRYSCGDFRTLDLQPASFDLVILSEVIEHVPEEQLESMFAKIAGLLTTDGLLLLSVPNRKTLRNRCRMFFGLKPVIMDKTHLREYERPQIDELIARLPFRMLRFAPAVLYFPFEKLVRRLLPPESGIRTRLIRSFPDICSHFIFLLKRN